MLSLNHVPTDPRSFESLWLLARRIMRRNCLRPHEFLNVFQVSDCRARSVLYNNVYDRVDLAKFARFVAHTPQSVQSTRPQTWEFAWFGNTLAPVKLCRECARIGYHSVFHELEWLDHCPIHECGLWPRCPTCRRLLGHTSLRRLGPSPNELPCGHRWTDADLRYAAALPTAHYERIATWLRRLHGRNTGERWYAVALGGSRSLSAADEDFRELLDLFAAVGGFPETLRDSLRRAPFVATRPVCLSVRDLRTDWFESALQRAGRYASILHRTDYDVSYMGDHRTEAVYAFRRYGKDAFVRKIRARVEFLDLKSREYIEKAVPRSLAELLAATFLRKHLLANTVNRADPRDADAYLRMALRMTGQPLGLLCESESGVRLYWVPLAGDHQRYLKLLKEDDWIIRRRRAIRERIV